MRLSELQTGQKAIITKILGHGAFRKRVMEMGFVRGREVEMMMQAPLRDPVKYRIMDYEVSLRRSEGKLIEIIPLDSEENAELSCQVRMGQGHGVSSETIDNLLAIKELPAPNKLDRTHERTHTINVAFIGNPNCGKTSLFNRFTGGREHVGNYSGVTVDAKEGNLRYNGYSINIVDLPGTYSLASYSPEELYVRRYLADETPDVIVNVVDASNLERNLYLTTELIDMDRSMVIALNLYDEMQRTGSSLDYKLLGDMIGVPIVPTVAKTGSGGDALLDTIINVFEGREKSVRHIHVHLGPDIEKAVSVLKDKIKKDGYTGHHLSPRYLAIKLLEKDHEVEHHIADLPDGKQVLALAENLRKKLKVTLSEEISDTIAAEKYGFIAGALAETLVRGTGGTLATHIIDRYVTNKYIGFPLFFAVMCFTFWLTFFLGSFPMEWIQLGVDALSNWVAGTFPDGPVKDMIADGIIGGVGGVIVFLPNILILYLCISFMEDTGYMARAAFIMDKVMHRIGLHGKSFIPLVMGFGCNVPAVMASRTIESKSSRIITILINPFMSCSARVPIYVLLVGTFFPKNSALMFMLIYIIGILVSVVTAKLLRKFWFKKDETPFVMELPPYRIPTLRNSLRHMWDKGEQYLRKMAGLILFASIIVWALNYFPRPAEGVTGTQHESYLQMAGKTVQPVMEPLGFHWKETVAAMAGVPAKEIVVSTLGVLYTGDETVNDESLGKRLQSINPATGKPDFTPASALAFMVFILLYCPCSATIIAIVRETGSWKYGLFSAVYNTAIAWVVGLGIYRLALLFGLGI